MMTIIAKCPKCDAGLPINASDPEALIKCGRCGSDVRLEADTICVHGDTPGSDDLAARIRAGFEGAGVTVKAIGCA